MEQGKIITLEEATTEIEAKMKIKIGQREKEKRYKAEKGKPRKTQLRLEGGDKDQRRVI